MRRAAAKGPVHAESGAAAPFRGGPDRVAGHRRVRRTSCPVLGRPDGAVHGPVSTNANGAIIGTLEPGRQATYRITATVDGSPGTEVMLTGTVSHDEPDPDPANDVDRATVELVGDTTAPPAPPHRAHRRHRTTTSRPRWREPTTNASR